MGVLEVDADGGAADLLGPASGSFPARTFSGGFVLEVWLSERVRPSLEAAWVWDGMDGMELVVFEVMQDGKINEGGRGAESGINCRGEWCTDVSDI